MPHIAYKKPSKSVLNKLLTRKQLRKQKQRIKMENKRKFFSYKTEDEALPDAVEKIREGEENCDKKSKRNFISKLHQKTKLCKKRLEKVKCGVPRPNLVEMRNCELTQENELVNISHKHRIRQFELDKGKDDKIIVWLEKKLKLHKTPNKNRLVRQMFNDGLDYALELCLSDGEGNEEREITNKRKQHQANKYGSSTKGDLNFKLKQNVYDDRASRIENMTGKISEYAEDIYKRKQFSTGNIIEHDSLNDIVQNEKYISPHQRDSLAVTWHYETSSGDKQAEHLSKSCKGLLNRLSETNLYKICIGLEDLYMKNSRYNMNDTLSVILKEVLLTKTFMNKRMVQEHVFVLAYLHAQIGIEIGAHFLQIFVEQFSDLVYNAHSLPIEDKSFNNLVLVLSYLYIFKIYDYRLLLDIIGKLSDNLCEKNIECILLIIQLVGFKLRKDDPLAFKNMMLRLQEKISEGPLELKDNIRLKIMVDILKAVKNNNVTKIPKFDVQLTEHLGKQLKAMLRNKYVTTLTITMNDLLRVEKAGKWWVVGSAWSNNIDDGGCTLKTQNGIYSTYNQYFPEKLLRLVKQQKMNTDYRRNIFCIIMSADDYVDAFEKILHLSLKDQRSIAYVIIHCSLNEMHSNPYYSHLALRFCNYNREFHFAFQFATWDRIKDIELLAKQQIKNFGKFLIHMILKGALELSVLKVLDFAQLEKSTLLLMREIMVGLLLWSDEKEVRQVFERVAKNRKLNSFRTSIRLFMQYFFVEQRKDTELKLTNEQMSLLERRLNYADNILMYIDM